MIADFWSRRSPARVPRHASSSVNGCSRPPAGRGESRPSRPSIPTTARLRTIVMIGARRIPRATIWDSRSASPLTPSVLSRQAGLLNCAASIHVQPERSANSSGVVKRLQTSPQSNRHPAYENVPKVLLQPASKLRGHLHQILIGRLCSIQTSTPAAATAAIPLHHIP